MTTLIKDLIDIPERVQKGDFVLKLTEGVTRAEATVRDYVVTGINSKRENLSCHPSNK